MNKDPVLRLKLNQSIKTKIILWGLLVIFYIVGICGSLYLIFFNDPAWAAIILSFLFIAFPLSYLLTLVDKFFTKRKLMKKLVKFQDKFGVQVKYEMSYVFAYKRSYDMNQITKVELLDRKPNSLIENNQELIEALKGEGILIQNSISKNVLNKDVYYTPSQTSFALKLIIILAISQLSIISVVGGLMFYFLIFS